MIKTEELRRKSLDKLRNYSKFCVQTRVCSWRSKSSGSGADSHEGAQIDLLIDRKDETVNICEIKYYKEQFEISKDYEEAAAKQTQQICQGDKDKQVAAAYNDYSKWDKA